MIEQKAEKFREDLNSLRSEIGQRIVGLQEVVEYSMAALFLGGHVLLEGVPGLGKTLLVKSLSEALDLQFSRIQFTPDLMPADITGTNIILETGGSKTYRFQKGPVFAHILLADEINRATPKTQSALLEAMQERSVTVTGERHSLDEPFCVLATQNPIEMEGTYPLPEAQLDRFLYKLMVPFPEEKELLQILTKTTTDQPVQLKTILNRERIREISHFILQVPVAEPVLRFASSLVLLSHPQNPDSPESIRRFVRYGSSPRGAQALVLSAKFKALMDRRYNAAIDDVIAVALPCLRHRFILNIEGQAEGVLSDTLIHDLLHAAQRRKSEA